MDSQSLAVGDLTGPATQATAPVAVRPTLMTLPTEVRLEIYKYLFPPPDITVSKRTVTILGKRRCNGVGVKKIRRDIRDMITKLCIQTHTWHFKPCKLRGAPQLKPGFVNLKQFLIALDTGCLPKLQHLIMRVSMNCDKCHDPFAWGEKQITDLTRENVWFSKAVRVLGKLKPLKEFELHLNDYDSKYVEDSPNVLGMLDRLRLLLLLFENTIRVHIGMPQVEEPRQMGEMQF
ncbi:hypothetical protein NA57DRAFT_75828 [Rhizodiscina lignyota]|uniref:Uncharacterized protein n=1 Tax=Rhizodiscina lignyota TaxID=1504668 RepID=A0A9P4M666_9PEZI|nr:hypothetical protein NA57DRAFT_75828 [Rhizodiscina lignyota]